MPDYAPKAELAPRDVVARSVIYEMEKTGSDKVYLDVTHLPVRLVTTRFPNIYRFCLDNGLDMTRELIPVAPVAHYLMGGVRVDLWGETNISGLFAVGEVACTGAHGATRLASNSLLEAVVFGKRAIEKTKMNSDLKKEVPKSRKHEDYYSLPDRENTVGQGPLNLSDLQSLMWDNVGIIRSGENLLKTANTLLSWERHLAKAVDRPSYELRNLILCGQLMTEAALLREESRGAHFRSDFPRSMSAWQHHVIFKRKEGR